MNVPDLSHVNPPLLRALRAPVMVIVTGILFLIDHSGGAHFGQTWPVLLIVLGLLRLAEYAGARKA